MLIVALFVVLSIVMLAAEIKLIILSSVMLSVLMVIVALFGALSIVMLVAEIKLKILRVIMLRVMLSV
jgi:hypothetical protein